MEQVDVIGALLNILEEIKAIYETDDGTAPLSKNGHSVKSRAAHFMEVVHVATLNDLFGVVWQRILKLQASLARSQKKKLKAMAEDLQRLADEREDRKLAMILEENPAPFVGPEPK